ncbi:MAG TPA: hypothetical protein VKR59_20525 [Terriglobales bacterium]|nr:hypothetical protein [Terriglobales bacterium]
MKRETVLASLILIASFACAQAALPTGTSVKMKLETTLATFSSKAGDPFSARVTEAVVVDGRTVIPIGATVEGRVTKSDGPRRIAGKPTIAIFPENLILPNGDRFMLNATLVDTDLRRGTDVNNEGQFKGAGHDGKDLTEIGMGTGGGMLIGGLAGGGKGLLIGGAVGATVTVAHWLGKHRDAKLPAGTELVMELNRPMTMTTTTPVASGGQ